MKKAPISPKTNLIVTIDDYHPQNVWLAERFAEIGIDATFYLEVVNPEAQGQAKVLSEMGFEVGSHSMTHPMDFKLLTRAQMDYEVGVSKQIIEEATGVECTSFCYPRGRYNDMTIQALKDAGYTEARTTEVLRLSNDEPFRTKTTIHVYSGRTEYQGRHWLAMARGYWQKALRDGGDFHIWGHYKEMLRDENVKPFLEFVRALKNAQALHEDSPAQ